jgi:hypothetical protein
MARLVYCRSSQCQDGADVFFYELHEGDNEVFSDVLVASDSEWEAEEFFELVQKIRRRIQDQFHHDTLVEAIAIELERDHGFVFISDDRLMAAVNVSTVEEDNFLTELEVDIADRDEDDDDDDEEDDDALPKGTYKTIYVDLDLDPDPDAPLH